MGIFYWHVGDSSLLPDVSLAERGRMALQALPLAHAGDVVYVPPGEARELVGSFIAHLHLTGLARGVNITDQLGSNLESRQVSVRIYGSEVVRRLGEPKYHYYADQLSNRRKFLALVADSGWPVVPTYQIKNGTVTLPAKAVVKAVLGREEHRLSYQRELTCSQKVVQPNLSEAVFYHYHYQDGQVYLVRSSQDGFGFTKVEPGNVEHLELVQEAAETGPGVLLQVYGFSTYSLRVAVLPPPEGVLWDSCFPGYHETLYPALVAKRLGLGGEWYYEQVSLRSPLQFARIESNLIGRSQAGGLLVIDLNQGLSRPGVLFSGEFKERKRQRALLVKLHQ